MVATAQALTSASETFAESCEVLRHVRCTHLSVWEKKLHFTKSPILIPTATMSTRISDSVMVLEDGGAPTRPLHHFCGAAGAASAQASVSHRARWRTRFEQAAGSLCGAKFCSLA